MDKKILYVIGMIVCVTILITAINISTDIVPFISIFALCGIIYFASKIDKLNKQNTNTMKKNNTTPITTSNENIKKASQITTDLQLMLKDTKSSFNFNIPDNILNLLWFGDGPKKNYDATSSNRIEPSCIFTNLKIELVENYNLANIENLDYYPTYKSLTPKQRFYYLKWLEDVTQPIPIGYVYIFYYGLERHLMKGKFDLAFKEIIKLRQNFPRINGYSSDALLLACFKRNKPKHLEKLFDYLNDFKTICIIKIMLSIPLLPYDLINIRKVVGFTNDYYIKKDFNTFLHTLENVLIKYNNKPILYIDKKRFSNISSYTTLVIANMSLPKRENDITDYFSDPTLCQEIKDLLIETHNNIKLKNG